MTEWIFEIYNRLTNIIRIFTRIKNIIPRFTFQGNEKAISMVIYFNNIELYVVLNHKQASSQIMLNHPAGIMNALMFLNQYELPELKICQLYFDLRSRTWKYLFIPTSYGFGRWIDRYVDLDDEEIHIVSSQEEFIELFNLSSVDKYKFIINPYEEPRW